MVTDDFVWGRRVGDFGRPPRVGSSTCRIWKGRWLGALLFGLDQKLLRGRAPWTLHNSADHDLPIRINLARFDAPETRYCPAGVHEIEKAADPSRWRRADLPGAVALASGGCRIRREPAGPATQAGSVIPALSGTAALNFSGGVEPKGLDTGIRRI